MKNILVFSLLIPAFALMLHGCCGAIPNITNSTAGKLCPAEARNCYENNYFSVTYPDGWTVEGDNFSKKFYFNGPGEIDSRPYCEILVGEPHLEWSSKTYINSVKIATKLMPWLNITSEGNRTIDGVQAYQVFAEPDSDHTLQMVSLLNVYTYSISCEAPKDNFSTYEPQFESIITSFKTW